MPENDGLMRVFWPADLPRSDHKGVVVGWRNSALDVFVLTILEAVEVCACSFCGGGFHIQHSQDGFANVPLAPKRRVCPQDRHPRPRRCSSRGPYLRTMRPIVHTRPRRLEYTRLGRPRLVMDTRCSRAGTSRPCRHMCACLEHPTHPLREAAP